MTVSESNPTIDVEEAVVGPTEEPFSSGPAEDVSLDIIMEEATAKHKEERFRDRISASTPAVEDLSTGVNAEAGDEGHPLSTLSDEEAILNVQSEYAAELDIMRKLSEERISGTIDGGAIKESIEKRIGDGVFKMLAVPLRVAEGLLDIPQDFARLSDELTEDLNRWGIGGTVSFNNPVGDGVLAFSIGTDVTDVKDTILANIIRSMPKGSEKTKDSLPRVASHWITSILLTGKFLKVLKLPALLASIGRTAQTGAVAVGGTATIAAGLSASMSVQHDETLLNFLHEVGIEGDEWHDEIARAVTSTDSARALAFDPEASNMTNRLKIGISEAYSAGTFEVLFKTVGLLKYSTIQGLRWARGIDKVSAADSAKAGEQAAMNAIDAAVIVEKDIKARITELLGDSGGDSFFRNVDAVAPKGPRVLKTGVTAPGDLEDVTGLADDMARSLAGRQVMMAASKGDKTLSKLFNFARMDMDDDVRRVLSDLAEGFEPEMFAPRGAPRTLAQVTAEGKKLDVFDLVHNKRDLTNPLTPELTDAEFYAARVLHQGTSQAVAQISLLYSKFGDEATSLAFNKVLSIHREVQRQVATGKASRSRALGALRAQVGTPTSRLLVSELDELIGMAGSDLPGKALAQAIANAVKRGETDVAENMMLSLPGLVKVFSKTNRIKAAGMVRSVYYGGYLSRFSTQIKNTLGTSFSLGMSPVELKVGNLLGRLGRESGVPGVATGEAWQFIRAQQMAMYDSFRIGHIAKTWRDIAVGDVGDGAEAITRALDGGAFKAFQTGKSGHGMGKVEEGAASGFSSEALGYDPDSNLGRVLRTVDYGVTMGPRGLVASDEVFKNAFFAGIGRSLALRKATRELAAGTIKEADFAARQLELLADPTPAMLAAMRGGAAKGTFTEMATGPVAEWLRKGRSIPLFGRLVLPFMNTPHNVTAWEIQRGPFGFLTPSFRNDIMSPDPAVVEMAWSRYLTSNLALSMGLTYFLENDVQIKLIGDTLDWQESEQNQRMNIQNMSVVLETAEGVLNIPFSGTDPIAYYLGAIANFIEILEADGDDGSDDDLGDLAIGVVGALTATFGNPQMISGLMDLLESLRKENRGDPERGPAAWFIKQSTSILTPGATTQFVQEFDNAYRETFSQFDRLKAKTPGLSDTLPFSYDARGRVRMKQTGVAAVLLGSNLPSYAPGDEQLPLDNWLKARDEFIIKPPKRSAVFRGSIRIAWKDHEAAYAEYVRIQGSGLLNPFDNPHVMQAIDNGWITPPANWEPEGKGLFLELDDLVEGKHHMSDFFLRELQDDEARMGYIRKVVSFYRRSALEIVLNSEDFTGLKHSFKTRAKTAFSEKPTINTQLRLGLSRKDIQ